MVATLGTRHKLADCPGTWLRYAVDEQTLKAETSPKASNWLDYQHVSHLPYVTRLFTDKRIGEYTRQALRRTDKPKALKGVEPPVWVERSIGAIEHALIIGRYDRLSSTPDP